jgi:hypothetical protein
MITDNIIISLNSKYATQRNGTYLSNVYFPFKGILSDDKTIQKKTITLINAQIPVSFYIINDTNNILSVVYISTTYNINLQNGNYSASTLITELTSKLSALSGLIPTITINKVNGRLTFQFNSSIQFLSTSTIKTVLGFTDNISGLNFTMPYPIDLLGTRNIYIKSQSLNISSFESLTTTKSNIIASISIDEAFYNMVSYMNTSQNLKHELRLNLLDGIDIQLTDENNNFINFNNINWTITLCLTIERDDLVSASNDLHNAIIQSQPTPDNLQEPKPLEQIKIEHDINQPTTLSGSLKQYSEALLKGSNNYTSDVINIIKDNGDNMIIKMTLKRRPISDIFEKALNYSTFGQFEKANPYDKLFHLAVILYLDNGKSYTLEKNATILLSEPTEKSDTEYFEVNYPVDNIISLNSLLERTRQRMGKKYFLYNAKSNNCQDFLLNVFDANNIGGSNEREFIKQDTRKIFNNSPSYLKNMAKFITDMGGRANNTKSFIFDLYKHKKDLNFLLK